MPLSASVIIPSYQRPEPLEQTLADVGALLAVPGEVLVVDQSPEPIRPVAETLPNGMSLRVISRPPGVVAARNAAAAEANSDVLIFLDDDVRISDTSFLRNHLQNYEDSQVDAVCGQELSEPDFTPSAPDESQFAHVYEAAEFFNRRSPVPREVVHLSTCNCSVRKTSFEKVGGFDEAFTGNSYGDDTDLAIRLAAVGARILFDPSASVRHLHWRRGGLRLNDPTNAASAFDRHLSSWLVYYRHVPPPWRRWFLWHRILRRQLLLKRNAWRLHRWPAILAGILAARASARQRVKAH